MEGLQRQGWECHPSYIQPLEKNSFTTQSILTILPFWPGWRLSHCLHLPLLYPSPFRSNGICGTWQYTIYRPDHDTIMQCRGTADSVWATREERIALHSLVVWWMHYITSNITSLSLHPVCNGNVESTSAVLQHLCSAMVMMVGYWPAKSINISEEKELEFLSA